LSRYTVVNRYGEKKFDCDSAQGLRMLALHQVRRTHKNSTVLQVIGPDREHEHPCRTHTSRGGLMAAIGRSQEYTTRKHGQVTGFKSIFPEDHAAFCAAVLDCLKSFNLSTPLFLCHAHHGSILIEAKNL
jgi:hypothetical protein